jgi:hypothetical protein
LTQESQILASPVGCHKVESQPSCISKPWPGFEDARAEFADANDLVTAATLIEIVSHRMTIKKTSTIKKEL